MADSEEKIRDDIRNYIGGSGYSSWYVGISEDPRNRLFNQHMVDEESDRWIFRWATSADVARRIERYFIDILGTDGASGGGDVDTRAVYGYKKKPYTDP